GSTAESLFEQAIEVARRQSSLIFELRATVSLSRLLEKLSRRQEARERLAAIYDAFHEGLALQELVTAKTLLDQLLR
ncbi:MAG TPA: hypothetical protein V6C72_10510, partial [Chroococcales cyanobacterium]